MIIVTDTQRTDFWRQARCGRLCASDASDMMATIKTGEAAARRDLKLRLVIERLTGQPQDDPYVNAAMQRGIDCEAQARSAYEALTGTLVREVGFLAHDTLMAGCSLDGELGGFKTLVELKAPKSTTHLGYVRAGKVPSSYLPQLIHQLWITGAEAVDFFSWDDRMPPGLQTFLTTVKRADVDIKAYELLVRMFLAEVDKELDEVSKLAETAAV